MNQLGFRTKFKSDDAFKVVMQIDAETFESHSFENY